MKIGRLIIRLQPKQRVRCAACRKHLTKEELIAGDNAIEEYLNSAIPRIHVRP